MADAKSQYNILPEVILAAGSGDMDSLRASLEDRLSPKDSLEESMILNDLLCAQCKAAAHGHLEATKYLSRFCEDIQDRRLLELPARNGHLEVVRFILHHYATLKDSCALEEAAKGGHPQVMEALIFEQGFEPSAKVWRQAALQESFEPLKVLVNCGKGLDASANACDEMARHGAMERLQGMLDLGCAVDEEACKQAVRYGNLEMLALLVDRGCSAQEAFNQAVALGQRRAKDVLQLLLDRNCAVDEGGACAIAARVGDVDVLRFLLDCNFHPDRRAGAEAVSGGRRVEAFELLLDRAGISLFDEWSQMSFIELSVEDPRLLKKLLERGFVAGSNAISMACKRKNIEAVELLLTHSCPLPETENVSLIAMEKRQLDVLKLLDRFGHSICKEASCLAARLGDDDTLEYLIRQGHPVDVRACTRLASKGRANAVTERVQREGAYGISNILAICQGDIEINTDGVQLKPSCEGVANLVKAITCKLTGEPLPSSLCLGSSTVLCRAPCTWYKPGFTEKEVLECLSENMELSLVKELAKVSRECRDRTRARRLRSVKLSERSCPPAKVRQMAENVIVDGIMCSLRLAAWPSLKSTAVRMKNLRNDKVAALRVPHMTELSLESSGVTSELLIPRAGLGGASALSQGFFPHQVRDLLLPSNALRDSGIENFANWDWNTLSVLNLSENGFEARGARALAEWRALNLAAIDISYNRIGSEGVRALARSQWAASIKELDLCGTLIGDDGLEALAKAEDAWRNLAVLDLGRNRIVGPDGLREFAQAEWPSLWRVSFEENSLCSSGLEELAEAKLCPPTEVILSRNGFGPSGAKALAKMDLPMLGVLNLERNRLGDEGARALMEWALNWDGYRKPVLLIRGNGIDEPEELEDCGFTVYL